MRLIDADKLIIPPEEMIARMAIANASTVELTEEQAIDKLHETGWMQNHDREMTEQPTGEWIEHISWKDIKEVQPKDGQRILYSYSYEYEPGKWEHRVELDVYFSDELSTFPMCCMTHWAEAPEPVVVRN